jgi:O-antigen ligase
VLLLPVARKIIPTLLVLLFVTWLLEGNFFVKWENFKKTKLALILPAFFVLHILGLCYAGNLKSGFFDLEVKLSLFFIPIVFVSNNEYYKNKINKILLFFIVGNIIEALFCLGGSFINLFYKYSPYVIGCFKNDPISFINDNFTYHFLSKSFHPSYFSMYCALCLQILIYFLYYNIYKSHKKLQYASILFFIFFIFLLSSKAGIITITILIFVNTFLFFKKKKVFFVSSLLIFLLTILLFATLKFNQRIIYIISQLKTTSINEKNIKTTEDRLLIWYNSIEIIKEHPIIGVGTGNVKDELLEVYRRNNMQKAILNNYNAHNQFLETFIALGFVGFSMLIVILIIPLINAIKKRDVLLLAFIVIISINFMFESMLNTQAGVVFFAFFYSFLNYVKPISTSSTLNT